MKENRRYYSCPLKACWMAKYFEMKFQIQQEKIDVREFPYTSGNFIGVAMYDTIGKYLGARPWHPDELLYIHPESLELLEPNGTLGDVCNVVNTEFYGTYDMCSGYCGSIRIIQRNGIAFMWPEEE